MPRQADVLGDHHTIVMALAHGYPFRYFTAFVLPLRAHYAGEVVLFTSSNASGALVDMMCYEQRLRCPRIDPLPGVPLTIQRWRLYAQQCVAPLRFCLASDFRDVAFQAHPFALLTADPAMASRDIVFVEESPNRTIGRCPWNSHGLLGCYGKNVLSQLQHRAIINGGTLYGTPAGFMQLAGWFGGQNCSLSARFAKWAAIVDQSMLNYLVHTGGLRGLAFGITRQGVGPVNTLSYVSKSYLRTHTQHSSPVPTVLNNNGDTSPVLHQHDRHSSLWKPFSDRALAEARASCQRLLAVLQGSRQAEASLKQPSGSSHLSPRPRAPPGSRGYSSGRALAAARSPRVTPNGTCLERSPGNTYCRERCADDGA